MTQDQLLHIINAGEGLKTEFKSCSQKLPKNLFETISAFLNTKGGNILLGVEDNGTISGIDENKLVHFKKDIANLSNNPQKLSPVVYLSVEEMQVDNQFILIIKVPESSQVHKTNDTIFIRNQDGDYRVNHALEIAKIVNRKQNYHSEQRVFPNVKFNGDLFSTVIYLPVAEIKGELYEKSSQKSSQKILNLISENEKITTKEMALKIGINRRAVVKQISKLKKERKIERIGSDKAGKWKIIKSL